MRAPRELSRGGPAVGHRTRNPIVAGSSTALATLGARGRDGSGRAGALLVPVLFRARPEQQERLRALARKTRIRQSELLREALDDLLAKYAAETGEAMP